MDFLLRHLNARGFVIAAGASALVILLIRFYGEPYRWYEDRKFARERGAALLATDISKDLDTRESLKLKGLYRDVSAEIAAAKIRGRPVAGLQAAADAAMRMDAAATRPLAIDNLNRLRVAIPQPLVAVRPSAAGDEPSDAPTTPPSIPSRRRPRSQ